MFDVDIYQNKFSVPYTSTSRVGSKSSDEATAVSCAKSTFPMNLPNTSLSVHNSDMMDSNQFIAKLFLIGSLELTDAAGTSFTPRSKKACALIALLALAPRRQRTRVWLRDKLWSESCERKSSTSMRQLIFELRRDLGWLFEAVLHVDRHSITLKKNALWIDYYEVERNPSQLAALSISPETELLEGIDIHDEEFEDWLLIERQNWADKSIQLFELVKDEPVAADTHPTDMPQALAPGPIPEVGTFLGLLPNIQQGCDEKITFVADHIVESIVKNLRELHPIDVFDLRDASGHSNGLINGSNTDYFIRVRALQIRQSLTLTFFFYHAANMSLEWSQSVQTTVKEALDWDSYILSGFVTQNVDRMSRSMDKRPLGEEPSKSKTLVTGYSALNMMFRLDKMALENAEKLLTQERNDRNGSLFSALRTYAASFKIGENLGSLTSDPVAETNLLACDTLSHNSFNSISLACVAHTVGYVYHDYNLAKDLLERALTLNPNQAFAWDHYALHKLYTGEYAAAHKAAKRAVYLGSYSPISYSYDTTLAMTSTMLGRHHEAIISCENALKKQPRFTAAMRYLLVNLAKTGREDEAFKVYQDLLARDPEFSDVEVQKARFRIAQKSKEADLIQSVKRFIS